MAIVQLHSESISEFKFVLVLLCFCILCVCVVGNQIVGHSAINAQVFRMCVRMLHKTIDLNPEPNDFWSHGLGEHASLQALTCTTCQELIVQDLRSEEIDCSCSSWVDALHRKRHPVRSFSTEPSLDSRIRCAAAWIYSGQSSSERSLFRFESQAARTPVSCQ